MTDDLEPSAYEDGFARAALPPRELWPRLDISALRARYPQKINAAAEILDAAQEDLQKSQIEDRLCDRVLRTRLHLVSEPTKLVLQVRHAGIGRHSNREIRARADRV